VQKKNFISYSYFLHKCVRDLFKYYLRTKENHYIHSTTIIYVKNTFLFFMKCLVQLLSHYLKNSRFLTSSNRYVKIPSKSRRELFNKTIADNILLWSKTENFSCTWNERFRLSADRLDFRHTIGNAKHTGWSSTVVPSDPADE